MIRYIKSFFVGVYLAFKFASSKSSPGLTIPQGSSKKWFEEDEHGCLLEDIKYQVVKGNRILDTETGTNHESLAKINPEAYKENALTRARGEAFLEDPESFEMNWKVLNSRIKNTMEKDS